MMSKRISYRLLHHADLPSMMVIEHAANALPWSQSAMTLTMEAEHHQTWGIFLNEQLIGFAVIARVLDEAELLNIVISPQMQRQGYGAQLLQYVIMQLHALGVTQVFLEVRQSNVSALALYQQLGFEQTGIRRAYYPLPQTALREDAILMAKRHFLA